MVDGKPVVRMYSKSSCRNCDWSEPIFDKVVLEYADRDLIVAYHWVFDLDDDTLTDEDEGVVPDLEYEVFFSEDDNPAWTVPYFSFGCRFTRVGNGYQLRNMPDKEEIEYRAVIEQILSS